MKNTIEAVIFDFGGVIADNPLPGMIKYSAEFLEVPLERFGEVGKNIWEISLGESFLRQSSGDSYAESSGLRSRKLIPLYGALRSPIRTG